MSHRISLKNGRLVDPSHGLDTTADLHIEDGRISSIGVTGRRADEEIDCTGWIVAPGFIDMHVHLRQPGNEEAETIATGCAAAAAGGFTAVACMPNTKPANDSADTTAFLLHNAENMPVTVLPIAAITQEQAGMELAPMEELKASGAIAFSDDGKPVFNSALMRLAMEKARALDLPIIDHCEDPYLFQGGAMNEGAWSQKLGIRGIPVAAEEIMVSRNVILAKWTGARAHMAHMSTAGAMDLIRAAKAAGIRVTCEVTPHHFTLTDEAVSVHGTNAKMNPPLRSEQDVNAVLAAIADCTVDVIASDHAPHHVDKKNVEFHAAAFGIIGLETSVSLGLDRLVHRGLISIQRFIELYSLNAAKILGISRGIHPGLEANLTIFDPSRMVTVDSSSFLSKSRNTPFHGWTLHGGPVVTICNGKVVHRHPSF